jgi:hypothetical protein
MEISGFVATRGATTSLTIAESAHLEWPKGVQLPVPAHVPLCSESAHLRQVGLDDSGKSIQSDTYTDTDTDIASRLSAPVPPTV